MAARQNAFLFYLSFALYLYLYLSLSLRNEIQTIVNKNEQCSEMLQKCSEQPGNAEKQGFYGGSHRRTAAIGKIHKNSVRY